MADAQRDDGTLRTQIEKSLTMTRPAEIAYCFFAAVFGLGLGALILLRVADEFEGYWTGSLFCALGLLGIIRGLEVLRRDERHRASMILEGAGLVVWGLCFLYRGAPAGRDYFTLIAGGAMPLAGLLLIVRAIWIWGAKPPPREPPVAECPTPLPPP